MYGVRAFDELARCILLRAHNITFSFTFRHCRGDCDVHYHSHGCARLHVNVRVACSVVLVIHLTTTTKPTPISKVCRYAAHATRHQKPCLRLSMSTYHSTRRSRNITWSILIHLPYRMSSVSRHHQIILSRTLRLSPPWAVNCRVSCQTLLEGPLDNRGRSTVMETASLLVSTLEAKDFPLMRRHCLVH